MLASADFLSNLENIPWLAPDICTQFLIASSQGQNRLHWLRDWRLVDAGRSPVGLDSRRRYQLHKRGIYQNDEQTSMIWYSVGGDYVQLDHVKIKINKKQQKQ